MEVSPEVSHGRHTAQSLTGLDVGGFSLPQRADPSRVGATATPTSPDLLPIKPSYKTGLEMPRKTLTAVSKSPRRYPARRLPGSQSRARSRPLVFLSRAVPPAGLLPLSGSLTQLLGSAVRQTL
jgi:hypothetical protein